MAALAPAAPAVKAAIFNQARRLTAMSLSPDILQWAILACFS
jgi:hypothetical protein